MSCNFSVMRFMIISEIVTANPRNAIGKSNCRNRCGPRAAAPTADREDHREALKHVVGRDIQQEEGVHHDAQEQHRQTRPVQARPVPAQFRPVDPDVNARNDGHRESVPQSSKYRALNPLGPNCRSTQSQ